MIKNYFKLAFRSMNRNKAFSFINIAGLSAGLATCFLIMLYILDERSVDKHHKDRDQVFRIAFVTNKGETWAAAPAPLSQAMKSELPEVERTARLMTFPDIATMLLRVEQGGVRKQLFESNGYYVDSTFFQIFTYEFLHGDGATALNEPNTIVISGTLAKKLFDQEDPLGRVIRINTPLGEFNYTVKAVFSDKDHRSHIPSNYFLSMRNNDMGTWVQGQTRWTTNNIFFTYVKLKKQVNPDAFEKKAQRFFDAHAGADMRTAGFSKTLFLQPLKDIYLHSKIGNEIAANGNIVYLYILASIAAFILLIACINFMNLSTARSQKRAREVGIRKVMGAEKSSLVRQFLGESIVLCFIALGLAIAISWILLPVFNHLTGKQMRPLDQPVLLLWILGLTLLTGFLAGIYPAFYLSAFKPVAVLKGKIQHGFGASAIRKGLVIFQFSVSICLMVGVIVIWQQLDLLRNQHLGFNKEQKIILPLQRAYKNSAADYTAIKDQLLKIPVITSVTSGSTYPGIVDLNDMLFYAEGKTPQEVVDVRLSAVENDYIETLGFKLLNGRSFSKEFTADSAGIILNEKAVRELGYTVADAVGKKIQFDFGELHSSLDIVGVVKDFNFESLHSDIRPCGFTKGIFANKYGYVIASFKTADYSGLIQQVGKAWSSVNPNIPFAYSFLDQDFQRNYDKEQRVSGIVIYFTVIAILIACLGLFGLAAFSAERRTKEVGIRKLLGASVVNITALLTGDFVGLVAAAMVIAFPAAWYLMNSWLRDFAYRVNISWWMFVVAGLLGILVALVTISFQAIKAATANPVKSLRSE